MSSDNTSLRLYNTLSKKEEVFVPIENNKVKMYTCGPTVYGRPHIGNYSSFLMADLLRRWLQFGLGYEVTHVKNITDVGHLVADQDEGEDKIEKQAQEERVNPLDIAKKYTEQYLEDERALNFIEPEFRPKATDTIKEMIAIINTLLQNKHAYESDDGIYFSVESFSAYGKLSGNTLENLNAGARISVDEQKKHPADFALWKKCVGNNARHLLRWSFATGEVVHTEGDDPSAGFPGWHIECSAMSTKFLGEQLDIHTGGEDNIFPHHECEIAQSECSSLKVPFSKYWLHRRRIDLGKEKMSKSLGNVLDLPSIVEKGFSPLDLRYYLLSVHYRTNLKFDWKGLEDAKKARKKIVEWMKEIEEYEPIEKYEEYEEGKVRKDAFCIAMNEDLNTPKALAEVFDAMKIFREDSHSSLDLIVWKTFIQLVRDTFGCFDPEEEKAVPVDVLDLVSAREEARKSKNFAESDRLRDQLAALGYTVRDLPEGPKIEKM